jgi:pimeloyl-ACP methyl ester carboxylesterase
MTADYETERFSIRGLKGRVHRAPLNGDELERAERPVFVLVHGIGTSHRYLSKLLVELGKVGTAYAFDLPGFGGTPKPGRMLSIEDFADFVARKVDALGLSSAVLVGHSMGSQVVVELARVRPDLISHVVLIGPVADKERRTALRQSLSLGRDILKETPEVNFVVFTDYLRCGPLWYLTETGPMIGYPTDERIRSVLAPVLVVRGGDDPIARVEWCRALVSAAPDARLLEIPGHRHVVQFSAPKETAAGILAFLGDRAVPREQPA